jgi:hypothetical protein
MATAKPKFLYDNRLNDGTPVASTTAAGNFNVLNLRDWRPFTWWKPVSLPATVTVDSGVARPADYALIYGHDLHDAQVAVEIRGSTDNFVASDVLVAVSNLLAHPNKFENAVWTDLSGAGTRIANAGIGPDGKFTADLITVTGGTYGIRQVTPMPIDSGIWALSVYAKQLTGTPAGLGLDINDGAFLELPLSSSWQRLNTVGIEGGATSTLFADLTLTQNGTYLFSGAQLQPGSVGYFQGDNNQLIFLPFASASVRYWQFRFVQLTGAVMPQIAIAAIGQALDADQYLSAPFDPRGAELVGQFNRSQKGHPLGSVIDFESYARTIEFEDVSWAWYRNSFRPAWDAHLRHKPFAFVWDPTDHANEIVLVTATPAGHDIPHRAGGYATLRLPVTGKIS